MVETVEILSQEWCSAENIQLGQSGFITKFESNSQKYMVLCNKEKYFKTKIGKYTNQEFQSEGGIRYRPIRFEDLNVADI